MNTFGNLFRVTSFGESHGPLIGGVIDGCPAGVTIDHSVVESFMSLRRPGSSNLVTQRCEDDHVEFVSGIMNGFSTGMPIAFVIRNKDHHTAHYDNLKNCFRPGHADYTYHTKYHGFRDWRGGGRASARETAVRSVAGAIASMLLRPLGVEVCAFVSRVGKISMPRETESRYFSMDPIELRDRTICSEVRCPDFECSEQMTEEIISAKADKDSVGGMVSCVVKGVPIGWGEPVYDKLDAMLAGAMLGINAVKGFEVGDGFLLSSMKGSDSNDWMYPFQDKSQSETNHCGGILGGISNGKDIIFRVAFKPTPTIAKPQMTIDINNHPIALDAKGRHDPAVVIRGVAVVESMAWITLADAFLMSKSSSPVE